MSKGIKNRGSQVHKVKTKYVRSEQNQRSTFHGDDDDFCFPYNHRYDEPDSERGATDENH